MKKILLLPLLLLAAAAQAAPGPMLFGPYKDVSQGIDRARPEIATAPWEAGAPRAPVLVWAFATGECGQERWGDFDTDAFARLNVAGFERAGRNFIVSTGGEAGGFSCASDTGMQRFLARYASPRLVGLDFDIERGQTRAQIDALVRQAQAAQRAHPSLRISFTIATLAARDGSRRSLNSTGEQVLASLAAAKFERAILNLMVMNYGLASANTCVVDAKSGRCDMGRSALQAARNVHQKYGVAWRRIALTPMLGENDVAGNVLTPADAKTLALGARRLGLAGVHWWSLDRDQPCAEGQPRVSPRCHALPGSAGGRFVTTFDAALRAPRR